MNLKKLAVVLVFQLIFVQTYSQVAVISIDNIYNGNFYISECGTIDFENNSTITLDFWVKINKPSNHNTNDGTIFIITKQFSSASESIHDSKVVTSSSWNGDTLLEHFEITLLASSFLTTDGFLYAKFDEEGYNPIKTCNFPIIKNETPIFTISPSATSVSCNSTSSKTFTVDNVNNSPGSLEYHWNVGSGWKDTNGNVITTPFTTTTSSVNLVPYQYLPSDVQVTPYLDGVAYNTLISTVELSNFSTNNTIVGPSSVCSTGTY